MAESETEDKTKNEGAAQPTPTQPTPTQPTPTQPTPTQPTPASPKVAEAGEESLQERVNRVLTNADSFWGGIAELTIGILIIVACLLYVLERSAFVSAEWKSVFETIEFVITLIFLVEYLVRFWAKSYSIRYLFTPLALIDLASILPLLPLGGALDAGRVIRVLRILRILRLLRLLQSRQFFFGEIVQENLLVLRILFTVFCLFFITGGVLYEVESRHNPGFATIFDAFYFSVVTLTTVGFGDVTPVTSLGKGATMVAIMMGILMIPWQLANLARYMLTDRNKVDVICKFCGLRQHDPDASHCKACGNLIYQEYDGDDDA